MVDPAAIIQATPLPTAWSQHRLARGRTPGEVAPIRIGVIANRQKDGAHEILRELMDPARSIFGIEVHLEEETAAVIDAPGKPLGELLKLVDLFIIAGGDGSVLGVAREIYPCSIPILGVNIGSLGFLTSVTREELHEALEDVAACRLRISPRMAVETTICRRDDYNIVPCALNDLVVSRGLHSRLVRLRVSVNGLLVTEYLCDGLIVSTPTGSTAYSVSAGGPILHPESRALTITPICPHTLTNRSLVVGEAPIRIEVPPQPNTLVVQCDGQPGGELSAGDWIEIRPAPSPVLLAYTPENDFFRILRQKLKWSGANI